MEADLHFMKPPSKDMSSCPNLYLIGFMGTGKSTIGRQVASQLGLQFMDSDQAIEDAEGRSIADIFQTEGEAAFRKLERQFVESGHPTTGCLVSCGGGLVTQPGMMERLRELGIVVCLQASAETIYERTKTNAKRPLLQVDDPLGRIREMLKQREPFYRKASTHVLTDGRCIGDVASHVCRVYRMEAKQ